MSSGQPSAGSGTDSGDLRILEADLDALLLEQHLGLGVLLQELIRIPGGEHHGLTLRGTL